MGNKEWPDDWKVGNGSARAGLGCLLVPVAAVVLAALVRWLWP